jgi:endonuclease/exonuclease/phosphatase family metal-dependent hydrolase
MLFMASRPASGRRGHRGFRIVVAVLALLGFAAAVTLTQSVAPTRSFASAGKVTVATWNMCGVQQWGCAGSGSREEKNRRLLRLATKGGARVILLQETCAADLESARKALGPSWRTAFKVYEWRNAAGRKSTVRCAANGQGAAGFAILSASALSDVTAVAARQPEVGLQRGILCAWVASPRITVCNAHLSLPGSDLAHPGWEYRDDQLRALVAAVPKKRTVYGGDLNLDRPGARNPAGWVWPPAPYRDHRECEQTSGSSRSGRATHKSGHKLDYLFTGLPRVSCTVRDTGVSDHRALLIRVRTG